MLNPEKIWSSTSLPTLPSVAIQLLQHSRNPEAEVADFVKTIKSDPAITAKIMKAANSAFFSFRSKVTTLERAVPLLGTNTVATLTLSFSLSESASGNGRTAAHYQSYWLQSVVQAIAAETLCRKVHRGMEAEFFLTGLMLDIGRLAMLKVIPNEYGDLLDGFSAEDQSLIELEQLVLGFDHVGIGSRMLSRWELPQQIIAAVECHHHSLEQSPAEFAASWSPAQKVALFSSVAGEFFCTSAKGLSLQRLQRLARDFYGMDEAQLELFLGETRERIEAGADLFSVSTGSLVSATDLMAEANEQLSNLALMAQMSTTQNLEQQMQRDLERQELALRNQQLESQVMTDALTGIYNRCFFDETFKKEISRSQRHSLSAGLLFCDIDHFKRVNDQLGHACGDHVLKEVARALSGALRTSDTLARYGGEEFVVMLVEADEKGVTIVGERVRAAVESLRVTWQGKSVPLTISVGGCICPVVRAEPEVVARQLLAIADEAMYKAKRNGKNQVSIRNLHEVAV